MAESAVPSARRWRMGSALRGATVSLSADLVNRLRDQVHLQQVPLSSVKVWTMLGPARQSRSVLPANGHHDETEDLAPALVVECDAGALRDAFGQLGVSDPFASA